MHMIHLQSLGKKNLRRAHHVRIIVVRKLRAQAVARLGGFSQARAELIRKNEVVLRRVQQLAGPEEHARKRGDQEHAAGAVRAMKNQHGIRDAAVCVPLRRADRRVVQPHLGKRLAIRKFEIVRDEIAFLRRHSSTPTHSAARKHTQPRRKIPPSAKLPSRFSIASLLPPQNRPHCRVLRSARPRGESQRDQCSLLELVSLGRSGRRAGARRALHRAHWNALNIMLNARQDVRERAHVGGLFLHPDNFARIRMARNFRAQFILRKRIELVEKQDRRFGVAALFCVRGAVRARFFRCRSGCVWRK